MALRADAAQRLPAAITVAPAAHAVIAFAPTPTSVGVGGPLVQALTAAPGERAEELRARARALSELRAGHSSRSYCLPHALVAWHADRVGIDIERIAGCDPHFGRSICTPDEALAEPWDTDERIVSLWCGKEALAKALGDALRYDPRRLESPHRWIDGAAGPWRARRLDVADGFCAWVCWRATAPAEPSRAGGG